MLTPEQIKAVEKGFALGFSDKHIARVVPNVKPMQVYNYRHKRNIKASDIVRKRYDTWEHLILNGMSISQISTMYDVTEQSIKVLLWKNKNFSLVEAKAIAKQKIYETQNPVGQGIPDLSQYGL